MYIIYMHIGNTYVCNSFFNDHLFFQVLLLAVASCASAYYYIRGVSIWLRRRLLSLRVTMGEHWTYYKLYNMSVLCDIRSVTYFAVGHWVSLITTFFFIDERLSLHYFFTFLVDWLYNGVCREICCLNWCHTNNRGSLGKMETGLLFVV